MHIHEPRVPSSALSLKAPADFSWRLVPDQPKMTSGLPPYAKRGQQDTGDPVPGLPQAAEGTVESSPPQALQRPDDRSLASGGRPAAMGRCHRYVTKDSSRHSASGTACDPRYEQYL